MDETIKGRELVGADQKFATTSMRALTEHRALRHVASSTIEKRNTTSAQIMTA